MKNTFGQSIAVTIFGESHGPAVGAVVDGLAPGIPVDTEAIKKQLARRRPSSPLDTARREADEFQILSGVFAGKTTGTPICIVIANGDTHSGDYTYGAARPSHADYAAYCKYHGYEDYRGGGHFSGRITAALTAVGGILIPALEAIGIRIGTHILRCADVTERRFDDVDSDITLLQSAGFPVLESESAEKMTAVIMKAKAELDSVGGVTESAVAGLPTGLGEPWFDSVEGVLSHALFSIGGVKGVEFGEGFDMAAARASECNDEFCIKNGSVSTSTNNNGGINGGITNGMPVIFRCAVKPTPSIARQQNTVDFINGENTSIEIKGRHDPAIIRRVCPVVDSVAAIVICDLLAGRFGCDVLKNGVIS